MRIWHIGDTHGRPKYLNEYRIMMNSVLKIIKDNFKDGDKIVLAGDDLHTHQQIHVMAFNEVMKYINELSKIGPVIKLIGNHELPNNSEYLTGNHAFNNIEFKNVTIISKPQVIDNVLYVPFIPVGRFNEAIQGLEGFEICFCHQEFSGARLGAIKSTSTDVWNHPQQVISGHIHTEQTLGNIYYPGSPGDFNFGDTGDKHIILYDNGNITKFPTEHVDYKTTEININDKPPKIDSNSKNRLIIHGDMCEIADFRKKSVYKKLQEKGWFIVFKPTDKFDLKIQKRENISLRDIIKEKIQESDEFVKTLAERINLL